MHRAGALSVLIFIGACSLLPSGAPIDGTWRLVEGTARGGPLTIPDGSAVTLTIDGADVTGNAGCNGYFGSVEIGADHAAFTGLGSTEMACERARMTLETDYLTALGAVTRAVRDGARLILAADGVRLAFEPQPPGGDAPLVGTVWQLSTVIRGDTAMSANDFDRATLSFSDDGSFGGAAPCASFSGSWSLQDGVVVATGVTVILAPCPSGAPMSAEGTVTDVVDGGFSARVEGSTLRLDPEQGTGLEYIAPAESSGG